MVLIIRVIGCSGSNSSSTDLKSGQSLKLSENALVCSSKDNVDKIISYINNDNQEAIQNMHLRGEATVLKSGTTIDIIKVGIVTEIETQNGERWFAPFEVFE